MNNYHNNNHFVNLSNLSIFKQKGGFKNVNATIIYQKDKNIEGHYDNMYIVLPDMSAYKMYYVNLTSQFIITVNVPLNEYFRFKFLRNTYLEMLDEDIELKKLPEATPPLNLSALSADSVFKDLNKWNTRWRWIKPSNGDVDYNYYFTYYVPYYERDENDRAINNIATDRADIPQYDWMDLSGNIPLYIVKNDNNTIRVKDSTGREISKITLPEVDINNIDDQFKINIVTQNTGKTITPYDDNYYKKLARKGVRNANMILYFQNIINHNVNLVKTQFIALANNITQLKEFMDDTSLTQKKCYNNVNDSMSKYRYWSVMYSIEGPGTISNTYIFYINGKQYMFDTTLTLKENTEITDLINNILLIFKNLLTVTVNCFNDFPMQVLEYYDFLIRYRDINRNYAVICLYLDAICKNQQISPTADYISNVKIDGKLQSSILLNPTDNYDNSPSNFFNLKTFNGDDDIKKYFIGIDLKNILSNEWIIKNIIQLYYDSSPITITGTSTTINDGFFGNGLSNSPLEKLSNKIKNNSQLVPANFYAYLYGLSQIAESFDIILDTDSIKNYIDTADQNKLTVELNGTSDTYESSTVKKKIDDVYKGKLIETGDIIYFYKYESISEVMRIFEKEIRLFNRSFWLDLGDISLDKFINDLSPVNRIKLYFKCLCIYTLLHSNHKNSKIKLNIGTPSMSTFKIDNEDLGTSVGNRSTIKFFNLINNNETLNKLFRLARYHMIMGHLSLNTEQRLLDNGILNLSNNFVHNIDKIPSSSPPIEFTNSNNYKNIVFVTKGVYDLKLSDGVNLLLKLVDEEKIGIGSGNEENAIDYFKNIVDDMYNKTQNASDVINIVQTLDLVY
jgi:hypothetical protein